MSKQKYALTLERLLRDIKSQPSQMRTNWNEYHRYKDNDPFTPRQLAIMSDLGIPVEKTNLVGAAINTVSGLEIKGATIWRIKADDDDYVEQALALNSEITDMMRVIGAKKKRSKASEGAFTSGIGWVGIGRNNDILANKWACENIHRDEMFWDMRSTQPDLSDCRWMLRRRFFDIDEIDAYIPFGSKVAKDELERLKGQDFGNWVMDDVTGPDYSFTNGSGTAFAGGGHIDILLDTDRERVGVIEVYYRVPYKCLVMVFPDGRREMFDEENPLHIRIAADSQVQVVQGYTQRMRQAMYIGGKRIADRWSPHPHNMFPYVPFFGYTKDADNTPYGLVENMISPQNRYNDALIRMTEIMTNERVIKDAMALHDTTDDELQREMSNRRAVINLVPGMHFEIQRDNQEFALAQHQADRASDDIRQASGIYSTLSGKSENQRSGTAVANLAELANQNLSTIMDNYTTASHQMGQLAVALYVEDEKNAPKMVNIPADIGKNTKRVELNTKPSNDLAMLRLKTVIAETRHALGNREQRSSELMVLIQALSQNPGAQNALLAQWVDQQDIPDKDKYVELIEKASGITDEDNPTEEQKQQMAHQQKMNQIAERTAMLQLEELEAKIHKDSTAGDLNAAKAKSEGGGTGIAKQDDENATKLAMLDQFKQQQLQNKVNRL